MRLRNVPGAREAIAESLYCYETPVQMKGKWHEQFGGNAPIHIEIGMGKGQFITKLALKYPDIHFIGIEKYSSVLIRGLERQEDLQLPNLCFIRMDAEDITEIFAPSEVAKIYLNFSDPWPKDRHAKRRLTSVQYLQRYEQILNPAGCIEFKTDNVDLFQFSLESVQLAGWDLLQHTFDLHNDISMNQGNIMTEYEERFSQAGKPICKLICKQK
jgi:tRNA (guanine-N7-)-methyltransferase